MCLLWSALLITAYCVASREVPWLRHYCDIVSLFPQKSINALTCSSTHLSNNGAVLWIRWCWITRLWIASPQTGCISRTPPSPRSISWWVRNQRFFWLLLVLIVVYSLHCCFFKYGDVWLKLHETRGFHNKNSQTSLVSFLHVRLDYSFARNKFHMAALSRRYERSFVGSHANKLWIEMG